MTDFLYTRFARPDSTAIRFAAYDDETEQLLVSFKDGNNVYLYTDVPSFEYEGLIDPTTSAGKYFQDEILGIYRSTKVTEVELEERVLATVTPITAASSADYSILGGDEPESHKNNDDLDALVNATNTDNSRYGVRWSTTSFDVGPFEASYSAADELDALRQFNQAVGNFGMQDVKVLAVTHYYE